MARRTTETLHQDAVLLQCSLAAAPATAHEPPVYLARMAAQPAAGRPDLRIKAEAVLAYQDGRVWNHRDPYHAMIRSLAQDVLALGRRPQ